MKKTSAKKMNNTQKRPAVRAAAPVKDTKSKPCIHTWSVSIYIYWFIVLFFFGASFYNLGIFSYPHTVLINRQGQEVGRIRGALNWKSRAAKNFIYKINSED